MTLAVAAALLPLGEVRGQTVPVELGLDARYSRAWSDQIQDRSRFLVPASRLRVGVLLTDRTGLEPVISVGQAFAREDGATGTVRLEIRILQHLTDQDAALIPFGYAGGAWSRVTQEPRDPLGDPGGTELSFDQWGVVLGGGLKLGLTEHLYVRGQVALFRWFEAALDFGGGVVVGAPPVDGFFEADASLGLSVVLPPRGR